MNHLSPPSSSVLRPAPARSSFRAVLALAGAAAALLPAASPAAVLSPDLGVMTSSFFMGANTVRGYAGDNRPTFRVSTPEPFGLSGAETIYLAFQGFDPAAYSSPVASAILSLTSVDGGQGANAGADSPFLVTAHGVSANPFTSITDDTNPGGSISWLNFYNNNILPADSAASTPVNGFGSVSFDVTELVNSWINGTNTNYFIALTGKNDTSGNDFLHGFTNHTETPGSTFLTVVPEPGSALLLTLTGSAAALRHRRRRPAGQ